MLAAPVFALGLLASCQVGSETTGPAVTPAPDPLPSPIVSQPWIMATASVSNLDRTAAFFRDVGGYETLYRGRLDPAEIAALKLPHGASGEVLTLRAPGSDSGFVRLIRFDNAGRKVPTRPGARAWDTGCFWSFMVRAHDIEAVYDDAIALGWGTETPIAPLSFNGSELRIVVFKGPDGLQVQAYERLNRPPPEGFTPFERLSRPFNIMQMTRDREAVRELMEDVLGFERVWYGVPYTDEEPTLMPLGIPQNLTTSIPYKAGIFTPQSQTLYGRMEYIEIDGLDGFDYTDRCDAPNLGWLSVTYPVNSVDIAKTLIEDRGWKTEGETYSTDRPSYGAINVIRIKAPDGATIEFAERVE
jgi:catechol 2,3-dioxygenase-like lactoylglutathione lyase family enzyme